MFTFSGTVSNYSNYPSGWLWNRETLRTYNCSRGGNPFCHTDPIPTVIQPQGLCDTSSQVDLLIAINSAVRNVIHRMRIRNSWLKSYHPHFNVKHVFVLALPVTQEVRQEAREYNDVLVGDFVDHYRNLTKKTVLGFRWSMHHCLKAKHYMKMDDDMYVNLDSLGDSFHLATLKEPAMFGRCYVGRKYRRRPPSHKWYLSVDEYPDNTLQPYCCGCGYVMSGSVARDVAVALKWLPLFSLEDALVGLAVSKLYYHVTITDFRDRFDIRNPGIGKCRDIRSGKILTMHQVKPGLYSYFSDKCRYHSSGVPQNYGGRVTRVNNWYPVILEMQFNWLALGRYGSNIYSVFFALIGILNTSREIGFRWVPQNPIDDKSTLVHVMAWCRPATGQYPSQCCARYVSPYSVTRPQWVKSSAQHPAIFLWHYIFVYT